MAFGHNKWCSLHVGSTHIAPDTTVTDMSSRSSPCVIIILKFDLKVNKNGLTRLFFIGIIDDQYQISTLCTLSEVCVLRCCYGPKYNGALMHQEYDATICCNAMGWRWCGLMLQLAPWPESAVTTFLPGVRWCCDTRAPYSWSLMMVSLPEDVSGAAPYSWCFTTTQQQDDICEASRSSPCSGDDLSTGRS